MNTKELLENAAKAVGIEAGHGIHERGHDSMWIGSYEWNPLTDDGDALRLAVKLRLEISHFSGGEHVCSYPHDYSQEGAEVPYGADPYAATRLAIVKAAAEIGSKL